MFVCVALFALVCTQSTAGDLIKAIEAVQDPPLTSTAPEAIAIWEKGCDEAAAKKAELIWKLYANYPADKEVPKYLSLRWDGMTGRRKPCDLSRLDELDRDLKAFLAKPQLSQNRETAMFWSSKSRLWRAWKTMKDKKILATDPGAKEYLAAAKSEADQFQKGLPKVADGAILYYDLSQMGQGTQLEIDSLQTLAAKYPDHRLAPSAKGRAKMLSLIGKPFDLQFDDVKTGKRIDIKSYRGKVVLLDFWATWCQPCRLDIETNLLNLATRMKDKGLEIIGISLDVTEDKGGKKSLLSYIEEKGISWPNYYDGKGQFGGFATDCGVLAIPTQFLIDREGILRSINATKNRDKLLEQYLNP